MTTGRVVYIIQGLRYNLPRSGNERFTDVETCETKESAVERLNAHNYKKGLVISGYHRHRVVERHIQDTISMGTYR